jgi:stage II sporulation protein R
MNKFLCHFNGNKKKFYAILAAVSAITILLTGIVLADYSERENTQIAQKMIRLHVLANSNSKEDQALKLKVRDSIIAYLETKIKKDATVSFAEKTVTSLIPQIETIAEDTIVKNGYTYGVKAEYGKFLFPTKDYGDISLPAGVYDALRVKIGAAKGANWWCVLFPPLCFIDATHGVLPDSAKQNLKNELSTDQYDIITAPENKEDIPIKVKFKILELFSIG